MSDTRSERPDQTPSIARRTALKGAGVAAATVWVAPLVQVISMDTAAAASAPPSRVQPSQPGAAGGAGSGAPVAAGSVPSTGALPKTGADGAVTLGAIGAGAVAAGAAAVVASRRRRTPAATDTEGSAGA